MLIFTNKSEMRAGKSFILFILSKICFVVCLQCMDQNNQTVDWFAIYKLPKEKNSDKLIEEGVGYVYITSRNYSKWTYSDIGINDTKSMLSYTMTDLFHIQKKPFYILYNDQPPYGSSTSSKGHTKGVVMAEKNGGFWLIHSVPHFPHSLTEYSYPSTGVHYGQSMLCVSLNIKNLNFVGVQLQYNNPHIFAQNIVSSLETDLPELVKAAQNVSNNDSPWYNVMELTSKEGIKFTSFAKSDKFDKDLYADLVAPTLMSDLHVETWPNEANRLPSNCENKYRVDNVVSLTVAAVNLYFKSTVDHSKWAVSSPNENSSSWICIGDINRAQSQTVRGGGTTCLDNKKVAKLYQDAVLSYQKCSSTAKLESTLDSNSVF